jgi:hypothetical protein
MPAKRFKWNFFSSVGVMTFILGVVSKDKEQTAKLVLI